MAGRYLARSASTVTSAVWPLNSRRLVALEATLDELQRERTQRAFGLLYLEGGFLTVDQAFFDLPLPFGARGRWCPLSVLPFCVKWNVKVMDCDRPVGSRSG